MELAANQAEVGVFLAHVAQDETEYRLSDIYRLVMLDKECLKLVVFECFLPELAILVADVGQHGGLRMQVVVKARFCDDAALNIVEQTMIDRISDICTTDVF